MNENWLARVFLFGFAGILCLFPITRNLARANLNEEQLIESVQKNYDTTVDFVAEFQQETAIQTLNRNLKAWGKVSFKRPGRMFWHYEDPKGQFVLADGKNLYFYQPDQNQILKTPLKNAFRSNIPLSFLLGIGNLKRDFKTSVKRVEEGHFVLQLETKGEWAGFSEILLGIDKKSYNIIWGRIRDAAGNITTIRFSDIRKGVGLKDSLFRLQIPEGADVVELGQ